MGLILTQDLIIRMTLLIVLWKPHISKAVPSVTSPLSTTTFSFQKNSNAGNSYRQDLNVDISFFFQDIDGSCIVSSSAIKDQSGMVPMVAPLSVAAFDEPTLIAYVYTNVPIGTTDYKLNVAFNCGVASTFYNLMSDQFTIDIICPACDSSSITLTQPEADPFTANDYSADLGAPSSVYTLNWDNFVSSDTACCAVTSYQVYQDNSYTTAHTYISLQSDGDNKIDLQIPSDTLGTWQFWLAANVQGIQWQLDYNGIKQLSLTVACGSSYGVITASHPSSYPVTQYVPKNDAASTFYVLPTYSFGTTGCTFGSVQVVNYNPECNSPSYTYDKVNEAVETSPGSGIYKVVPQDITISQFIRFSVIVTNNGGFNQHEGCSSQRYDLYVGCYAGQVSFTNDAGLVTSIPGYISASDGPYTYTFLKPSVFPSSCTFTNSISVSPPSIATYDDATAQVTFNPSFVDQNIWFTMVSTDEEGNVNHNVTIQWQAGTCNSSSTIISQPSSVDSSSKTFSIDGSTLFGFDFAYFSSSSSLCSTLTYELYDSTGSTLNTALDLIDDSISKVIARIKSSAVNTKTSYSFKLKITAQGGAIFWASVGGSEVFTLYIVCGPSTIILTEQAFAGTYTSSQVTSKTAAQFFLPPYVSSQSSLCPIITYLTSSTTGSLTSGTTGMNDPAVDGSSIVPTNSAIDKDYYFYVQVMAEGGAVLFSSHFTLIVGCTSSLGVSYNNIDTTHYVRNIASNLITQVVPSLDRTYCSVTNVELTEMMVDGVSSNDALFMETSCTQPCEQISLLSIEAAQSITYKLIYTIDSTQDVQFTSNSIVASLTCQEYSTDIFSTLASQNFTFYLNSNETTLEIPEFNCSNPTCCPTPLTYTLSKTNTLPIQTYTTLPALNSTIPVTVANTYSFYIHAANEYGSYVITDIVYVDVKHDCQNDEIFYVSETEPDADYLGTFNSSIARWWPIEGRYRMKFETFTNKISNFSIDFSKRFKKKSNEGYYGCPFSLYRIDDVVEEYSKVSVNSSFSDQFSFNTTSGVFSMVNFNEPYANYLIYVSAYNGKIWSNYTEVGYLAKFTLVSNEVELPPVAPFFESSLLETINLTTSAFSNETVEYQLPEIIDLNVEDRYVVSVSKLENFIVFVQSTNTFRFDQSKLKSEDQRSFTIKFNLVDTKNKKNRYELLIIIKDPFVPAYGKNELSNMTAEGKNPYTNCSAQIVSISRFGDLKIKFYEFPNATQDPSKSSNRMLIGAGNFNRFQEVKESKMKELDEQQEHWTDLTEEELEYQNKEFEQEYYDKVFWEPTVMQSIDLKDINESSISIYLEGANSRFQEENFDFGSVNYTWNATEQDEDSITIKLNFTDPSAISPDLAQDTVVVVINPEFVHLFRSKSLDQDLNINFLKMRSRITKQLPQNAVTQALDEGTKYLELILKLILIILFLVSMELPGAMTFMLVMLRMLQMILHLPFVRIAVPGNISLFFNNLIPLAMFDFTDPTYTTELFFKFNHHKQKDLQNERLGQIVDLGYTANSFTLNLGSLALFMMIYLIKLFLFAIFCLFLARLEQVRRNKTKSMKNQNFEAWQKQYDLWVKLVDYRSKYKKELIWSGILSIILEGCFEFMIAGYLQIQHPSSDTSGESISTMLGFFCVFLAIVVFPATLIYILRQDNGRLYEEDFAQTYGVCYEDIELSSRWTVAYYLIFVLRRAIFCIICFTMESGAVQIILLQYLNMVIIQYIARHRPHLSNLRDNIDIVNECFVTMVTMMMVFFTPWHEPSEVQIGLGWILIVFVISVIAFNMIIVFFFGFKTIRSLYIKYSKRWAVYKPQLNKKITEFIKRFSKPKELDQFDELKLEREVRIWKKLQTSIQKKIEDKEQQNEVQNLDEKSLELMAPLESFVVVKTAKSEKKLNVNGEGDIEFSSSNLSICKTQGLRKQKTQISKLKKLIWKPKNVLREQANCSIIQERREDEEKEDEVQQADEENPEIIGIQLQNSLQRLPEVKNKKRHPSQEEKNKHSSSSQSLTSSKSDDDEESKSAMASQRHTHSSLSPVSHQIESTNELVQTHQALMNELNQIKDAQQSAISILDQNYNPISTTTVRRSPPRLSETKAMQLSFELDELELKLRLKKQRMLEKQKAEILANLNAGQ